MSLEPRLVAPRTAAQMLAGDAESARLRLDRIKRRLMREESDFGLTGMGRVAEASQEVK